MGALPRQAGKVDNSVLAAENAELLAQVVALGLFDALKAKEEADEKGKVLEAGAGLLLGLAGAEGQGEDVGDGRGDFKELVEDAGAVGDDAGHVAEAGDEGAELAGQALGGEVQGQALVCVARGRGAQQAVMQGELPDEGAQPDAGDEEVDVLDLGEARAGGGRVAQGEAVLGGGGAVLVAVELGLLALDPLGRHGGGGQPQRRVLVGGPVREKGPVEDAEQVDEPVEAEVDVGRDGGVVERHGRQGALHAGEARDGGEEALVNVQLPVDAAQAKDVAGPHAGVHGGVGGIGIAGVGCGGVAAVLAVKVVDLQAVKRQGIVLLDVEDLDHGDGFAEQHEAAVPALKGHHADFEKDARHDALEVDGELAKLDAGGRGPGVGSRPGGAVVAARLGLAVDLDGEVHEGGDLGQGVGGGGEERLGEVDGDGGKGVDEGAVLQAGVHVVDGGAHLVAGQDRVDGVDLLLVQREVAEKVVHGVVRPDTASAVGGGGGGRGRRGEGRGGGGGGESGIGVGVRVDDAGDGGDGGRGGVAGAERAARGDGAARQRRGLVAATVAAVADAAAAAAGLLLAKLRDETPAHARLALSRGRRKLAGQVQVGALGAGLRAVAADLADAAAVAGADGAGRHGASRRDSEFFFFCFWSMLRWSDDGLGGGGLGDRRGLACCRSKRAF